MPRNPRDLVDNFSPVQKLVYLAMQRDSVSEEEIRAELVKVRRRAYEDEISIQAGRIGCSGRQGRLTSGPSLTGLNELSQEDAASITNTYNYDLAVAIARIKAERPASNRNHYVNDLLAWESQRNSWKARQIAEWAEGTARSRAQADFARFNDAEGVAVLEPGSAKEPICAGWIARGEVPLAEAMRNAPPYHPNCPHIWVIDYKKKVRRGECGDVWLGE